MTSKIRISALLFCISLSIRIVFLIPFMSYDIPLVFDEIDYFDRAVGFLNILDAISHTHPPSPESIERAYGLGQWPPLQPFLLGLAFFIFGKHIIFGRLLMVFISALTTAIVYLLTEKISNKKTAIVASAIHTFYLPFIWYSNYLLSETTYIFLLLLAIFFIILLYDAQLYRRKIIYAVFSGLFLGLCGLTRAAILPILFVVPLWLTMCLKEIKPKIFLTSIVIFSYLVVLLPWQALLIKREHNPGFLSNITGWYMHIGNNPWIPDGYGSSWQHDSRAQMIEVAREYAKTHSIGFDEAQRILAMQEIKRDFKKFLIRGVYKLRMLWGLEFEPLIHLFYAAYPPIYPPAALLMLLFVLISQLSVLIFAVIGFLVANPKLSKKGLILLVVIFGMATSFITFGIPRFHLPLLALLFPVTAHGVINLKQIISSSFQRKLIVILVTLLIFISIFTGLPLVVSGYLRPSSHYCGLITRIDKILGSNTQCFDRIIFRSTRQTNTLLIMINSKDYSFNLTQADAWIHVPKIQKYEWKISPENKMLRLDIHAYHTSASLKMTISTEGPNQSVVIQPIRMHSWRKWQPSGIDGIEYMWLGGGIGVRNILPDDSLYRFK